MTYSFRTATPAVAPTHSVNGPPAAEQGESRWGCLANRLLSCSRHFCRQSANPNSGIVKHGAAHGRRGIVTDQRIDADAALEIRIGPDALYHEHARLQPVEALRMHDHAAPRVTQLDLAAI